MSQKYFMKKITHIYLTKFRKRTTAFCSFHLDHQEATDRSLDCDLTFWRDIPQKYLTKNVSKISHEKNSHKYLTKFIKKDDSILFCSPCSPRGNWYELGLWPNFLTSTSHENISQKYLTKLKQSTPRFCSFHFAHHEGTDRSQDCDLTFWQQTNGVLWFGLARVKSG